MEHASAVALGGWRERLRGRSVRRESLDDNELVARTLRGDVRSYEELIGRYERLLRRRREIVEFNPETHAGAGGGPEVEALAADRSRSVQEAVATLPETYGVPLILRYSEGLSYAEIAEVLDISIPAVKSRLFRARNMMSDRLQEVGEWG